VVSGVWLWNIKVASYEFSYLLLLLKPDFCRLWPSIDYGNGDELELSTEITADLRAHHIPSIATHNELHKILPVADYISSYPTQILIECVQTSDEEFSAFLEKAPSHFGHQVAGYVNGTLIRECHSCTKAPMPRTVDGEYDDTDHNLPINGRTLRPGVLFENIGKMVDGVRTGQCLTNSGLAIEKDGLRRITGAHHGWEIADDDKAVYHGGINIRNVKRMLGEDIALIECKSKYKNTFLDIDCAASKFIPSVDIKNGDLVLLGSCFTGCQQMIAAGLRTGRKRAAVEVQGMIPCMFV
jgi:hypothetical protein